MKEDETTAVVSTSSNNSSSNKSFDSVVVHPLVLLSVVDHYKRVDEVCTAFFSPISFFFLLWSLNALFVVRGLLRAGKASCTCVCSCVARCVVVSRFLFSLVFLRVVETHSYSFFLSLSYFPKGRWRRRGRGRRGRKHQPETRRRRFTRVHVQQPVRHHVLVRGAVRGRPSR